MTFFRGISQRYHVKLIIITRYDTRPPPAWLTADRPPYFFTTTKIITEPDDIKGLRIRIPGGAVSVALYQALGAQVPFPPRLGNPDENASLALEMIRHAYFNGECVRLDGAIRMAPR